MADSFRYSIDLSMAQARAEKVVECIKRLRQQHDLRRFEYTDRLRVAPTEFPHSHPILTLNTALHDPEAILCEYLHEQMHWYLVSLDCAGEHAPVMTELKLRYPNAPVGFGEGANDEYSTYLHLLVNWLEIEVASEFIGRERVTEIVGRKHYYRWIYRTVLSDWSHLERDVSDARHTTDCSSETTCFG
jgi:hypothetical protein